MKTKNILALLWAATGMAVYVELATVFGLSWPVDAVAYLLRRLAS